MADFASLKWGRIVAAAALTFAAAFLLVSAVIFVYAFALGFRARGSPDPVRIQHFASQVAPWASRICLALFTFVGAAWVVRRRERQAQLHGLLTGLLVAVPALVVGRGMLVESVVLSLLTVGAGWLGGTLSRPRG